MRTRHTLTTDLMPVVQGFPRPDWLAIEKIIESAPPSGLHDAWSDWARTWVQAIGASLDGSYRIKETDTFIVLSAQNDRYVSLLSAFMERARRRILTTLDGIASDDGYGKHVALIFEDQESYYQYATYYFPEAGEFALSTGVFLDVEYGHFT